MYFPVMWHGFLMTTARPSLEEKALVSRNKECGDFRTRELAFRKPLQESTWRTKRNLMVTGEGGGIGAVAKIEETARKGGAISIEERGRTGDAALTGGVAGSDEISGRWQWISAFREP